ncbi:MAG: dehydrogenase [Xanthomonadales bacterium]|nr:dehydrogenase [Xanthomonadales bacterium]
MTWMLLIVEPPDQRQSRSEAEARDLYDRMLRFGDELERRGLLLGSGSLASHQQAARVSRNDGQVRVMDGPFAEAKEMIGGYYLLDCASHGEAVALAGECPAAEWCTVEVRRLAPCHEG